MGVKKSPGLGIIPRGLALDQIRDKGKGPAGKADQGSIQLPTKNPNGLTVKFQGGKIQRGKGRQLGRCEGFPQDGAFPLHQVKGNPHSPQRDQEIREQNRRIQIEPPKRLKRGLYRQLRCPAYLLHGVFLAELSVFGEVPARLTHYPDGRRVHRLSPSGLQNSVTHFFPPCASSSDPHRQV